MKIIELTQGRSTVVDDEDYEFLSQWKWQVTTKGYVYRMFKVNGKNKAIPLHRLLLKPPKHLQVDHINGDKLDNRKENLRAVNQFQNMANRPKLGQSSSIYLGVSKVGDKWAAFVEHNRRTVHLGLFKLQRHAAMARDLWAKDIYGEQYYQPNFP